MCRKKKAKGVQEQPIVKREVPQATAYNTYKPIVQPVVIFQSPLQPFSQATVQGIVQAATQAPVQSATQSPVQSATQAPVQSVTQVFAGQNQATAQPVPRQYNVSGGADEEDWISYLYSLLKKEDY